MIQNIVLSLKNDENLCLENLIKYGGIRKYIMAIVKNTLPCLGKFKGCNLSLNDIINSCLIFVVYPLISEYRCYYGKFTTYIYWKIRNYIRDEICRNTDCEKLTLDELLVSSYTAKNFYLTIIKIRNIDKKNFFISCFKFNSDKNIKLDIKSNIEKYQILETQRSLGLKVSKPKEIIQNILTPEQILILKNDMEEFIKFVKSLPNHKDFIYKYFDEKSMNIVDVGNYFGLTKNETAKKSEKINNLFYEYFKSKKASLKQIKKGLYKYFEKIKLFKELW